MDYDDTTVPITKAGAWPEVGRRSLVFFDDPEDPFMEQWRICSTIGSITRIGEGEASS